MSELPKGCSFLINEMDPANVFTPEDFDDEHKLIAETVDHFLAEQVFPRLEDLDAKQEGLMREMLVQAGELGLLGADIPERFDGTETDEICSTIIAEKVGAAGSFAIGHGGHTGIGNLPIVFFGNEEQKARYLPKIVSAEKISAYALTEPGSGSDALSAKTKAVLSEDGTHYILNGGKTFISNAGIADMMVVYAKIDGEKFSAFIVDTHVDGLTTGAEEHKMGLKGSSTTAVFFDNVKVPAENLLYEAGKGHVIAFNVLNIGRHKVASNSVGAAKMALNEAATYANERKQFNTAIANFGAIKEKIAEMASRIYAAESTIYRTGGMLTDSLHSTDRSGADGGQVTAKCIEEYALECSLEKVFSTEMEDFVVDEALQIHGGYGYIAEYPVERLYRDSRIRRIFEGTNEINRILVPTTLLKRAAKGILPIMDTAKALQHKLREDIAARTSLEDMTQMAKDVFSYVLASAVDKFGDKLVREQELLCKLADLAIYAYTTDSSLLRARKNVAARGERSAQHILNMATLFIYNAADKLSGIAKDALSNIAAGDGIGAALEDLGKLTQYTPVDMITLRREIAAKISDAGKYVV